MPQRIILIHKGFFLICKPSVLYSVSHNPLVIAYRYPPLEIHFETQSLHPYDVIPNSFPLQLPLKLLLMLFLPQVKKLLVIYASRLRISFGYKRCFVMVYATNRF
jgi:hypothetical protein